MSQTRERLADGRLIVTTIRQASVTWPNGKTESVPVQITETFHPTPRNPEPTPENYDRTDPAARVDVGVAPPAVPAAGESQES